MNKSWIMFRPEWFATGHEINGKGARLVAVAVGEDAHHHAAMIAAAPAMFNALVQIQEHLASAGELASLPYRLQWDLRAAIENAAQPVYTPSQAINSGEPSC